MTHHSRQIPVFQLLVLSALVFTVLSTQADAGWPSSGAQPGGSSIRYWEPRTGIGPVNYSTTAISGFAKQSYISFGHHSVMATTGSAFSRTPYFVSGPKGIPAKLLDEKGLYQFFEEEPIGNYIIKRTGGFVGKLSVTYRHIPDEKKEWRQTLTDALTGRTPPPVPEEAGGKEDAEEQDADSKSGEGDDNKKV